MARTIKSIINKAIKSGNIVVIGRKLPDKPAKKGKR